MGEEAQRNQAHFPWVRNPSAVTRCALTRLARASAATRAAQMESFMAELRDVEGAILPGVLPELHRMASGELIHNKAAAVSSEPRSQKKRVRRRAYDRLNSNAQLYGEA